MAGMEYGKEHGKMDYMIRATAADDQIRAFAAVSREMVEEARQAHNTSPVATAALGRLLTGGAMMGLMMKGDRDLLTLIVKGDGPLGQMVVTADSHGFAKGYVENPQVFLPANSLGKLDVGGAVGRGMLQVIRDLGLKEPYVGSCAIQTGEIGDDLTYYFTASEQVPSAVGLGVLMERNNTVRQAGGFILQLMPYTPDSVVAALEKKLAGVKSVTSMLDSGMAPEDILQELLGEFDVNILEKQKIAYRCDCSRERMERALISIGKKELQEMINDQQTIEIGCQFCGKQYPFTPEELGVLLKKAVRP